MRPGPKLAGKKSGKNEEDEEEEEEAWGGGPPPPTCWKEQRGKCFGTEVQ